MKIRLIALDLDGTLLTTDKRLTEHTRSVLYQAAERGIHIVPATGRSVTGLAPEVRDLPFVRYAITVNGAAVWDMKEKRLIVKRAIETERALEIWDYISGFHAMQDACIDGVPRMEPEDYRKIDEVMPDEPHRRLVRSTRTPTEQIRTLVMDKNRSVEKLNLFFPLSREEDRRRAQRGLEQFPDLAVTSSLGNNLEINHADATKGKGLAALAAHLGILAEQTMAFGDGENDISMLRAAGMGIAMGNASESVRTMADMVTRGNDEEGVAYAIEKYALNIG